MTLQRPELQHTEEQQLTGQPKAQRVYFAEKDHKHGVIPARALGHPGLPHCLTLRASRGTKPDVAFPIDIWDGRGTVAPQRMGKAKGRVSFWADLLWSLLGETSTVKTKSILLTSVLTPGAASWASRGQQHRSQCS